MDFKGKTVYITGAGSGIGLEAGRQLLKEGAILAVFDLKFRGEALSTFREATGVSKEKFRTSKLDVANPEAVENLLRPGGRLALIASLAGIVGSYGYAAYAASKFGVVGLAQVIRMEWKQKNLSVSVICPPEVEMPMVVREREFRPKATSAPKAFAGTLSVEKAVDEILKGLRKEKLLIIPGFRAKLTNFLVRFVPTSLNHVIADSIMTKAMKN